MLVGEVRPGPAGAGSAWKLSGGSQFSSGVTNVSKKCHVLRAIRRSRVNCSTLNSGAGCSTGRLIHHALQGAVSQRTKNGMVISRYGGWMTPNETALANAITGANHIAA